MLNPNSVVRSSEIFQTTSLLYVPKKANRFGSAKIRTAITSLKPIDNIAASKIMPLFGEIGLGTQYELPKSVKSYRIWAFGRGENRKMLKINELNSYLKSKGVPEDSYSINEVNDESLCIVEDNKKWHIFYSERGLRTEEYCYQDEHLAILYFINRLSKMLKCSLE